jgi:hypothetical protein
LIIFTGMNRRKALVRISLGSAAILAAAGGWEWYGMARQPDLDYAVDNKDLIAALAETILPATDTPGAKEAGVQDFILKMLRRCTARKEQNSFVTGLKAVQSHCRSRYDRNFQDCTPQQQQDTLALFEKQALPPGGTAGKLKLRVLGRPFFDLLKAYTIEGYCTSRPGATKGLAYAYIPGSFQGCLPLKPGQKSWATN